MYHYHYTQLLHSYDLYVSSIITLQVYMNGEVIAGVHCDHCNRRTSAMKCLKVQRPPKMLCLHVSRRVYNPVNNQYDKLDNAVSFDLTLDIPGGGGHEDHRISRYFLCAVVSHIGTAYRGHYVCYARLGSEGTKDKSAPPSTAGALDSSGGDGTDEILGDWALFSDSQVTPCSEQDVLRAQAYLLFYERGR